MLTNSDTEQYAAPLWCVVSGSDLWLVDDALPRGSAQQLGLPTDKGVEIGRYQGAPVMWLNESELDKDVVSGSLRDCLHHDEALFLLMSKAVQYGHMSQTIRFCPQCGGRTHLNLNQLAMQCGDCRTLHYPRIFPCIIVAVKKEGHILLAQHPRHRNGMYTVIAGFVEVGETLEQCVAREVKEETGVEVGDIQYIGSQPWAFPSSLMMAFTANYTGGKLAPDYHELTDAQWFPFDQLPPVAPKGTIARKLIDLTTQNT